MNTDRKIKVLVEGITSLVGGRETYIMTQYECIDTSCFHFDFVYDLSAGEFPDRYIGEVTSRGSKVFYLRTRQEWKDFLRTHTDYDFLILNLMSTCSIYYYRELKESSSFKKIILHSHIARNYPFRGFDRIGQRKELKSLRKRFDSLNIARWACSDVAGKWMFGEDSDFEVIKNGIYPEKFTFSEQWRKEIRDDLGVSSSDFLIGNVGRIESQKNQEYLIDILAKAKQIIPGIKLVIVGAIQQTDLFARIQKKISKYNLDEYVIFAGARDDVEKFYSAFDAFVFPSRYEGLGIVGLEAQASGLPCVFSDTVPRALSVNHKECRFLPISSQSVGDWMVALHDISKDKTRDRFKISSESYDLIKSAGYDVRVETIRVQKLLESYLI